MAAFGRLGLRSQFGRPGSHDVVGGGGGAPPAEEDLPHFVIMFR